MSHYMVKIVHLVVKSFHLGNYIHLAVFGDDSIEIIFTKLFSSSIFRTLLIHVKNLLWLLDALARVIFSVGLPVWVTNVTVVGVSSN